MGTFGVESIGKFETQNVRFFTDPYQEFRFPAVKAKYLKSKESAPKGRGFDGPPIGGAEL